MAKRPSVCVSTPEFDLSHTGQSEGSGTLSNSNSSTLAIQALGGRDCPVSCRPALAPPTTERPAVTSRWGNLPPTPRQHGSLGLAHEKWNLNAGGLKFLSLKTVLLLALTIAKRVSDLQALSIRPSCLQFDPGYTRVCLRPNSAYVPKVMNSAYRCVTVELAAFHPPPFATAEDQRLNCLCPVRALCQFLAGTVDFSVMGCSL
ncbi:hypothetical protein MHYP_G00257910 [Metynnis hypsauchen]